MCPRFKGWIEQKRTFRRYSSYVFKPFGKKVGFARITKTGKKKWRVVVKTTHGTFKKTGIKTFIKALSWMRDKMEEISEEVFG